MKHILPALLILVSGCATSRINSEAEREVVLQYIGGEGGTSGPFSKHQTKELSTLSAADQAQAMSWLEKGAAGFLVFVPEAKAKPLPVTAAPGAKGAGNRVILVLRGQVVGDYRAAP